MSYSRFLLASSLCGILAALPAPSPAQTAPAATDSQSRLQEIVVTAEKRETNLQHTPIAVTALGGAALADQQVKSIADIQGLVPGFQFSAAQGTANLYLRGVGISALNPTSEGSVAVNLNGVYVSRPPSQLTGFYDVSSIEVLRGPQGTLYGRNATAGSINIQTNLPTANWSGYVDLTAGNYSNFTAEGAVSGPLAGDVLTFRLAGMSQDHEGYGKNIVTGSDIDDLHAKAVRGTLLFKPTSNLTATLIGEYYREKDRSGNLHYFGATGHTGLPGASGSTPTFLAQGGYNATNILDEASDIDPSYYIQTYGFTGKLAWKPAEGVTVQSITGYRKQNNLAFTSAGGGGHPTPAYFTYGEIADQVSEELQLNVSRGIFDLTAGVYYFHERDTADPATLIYSNALFGGTGDAYVRFLAFEGTIDTTSKAAYSQGSVHLTDRLSLTAGIRYSHDDKDLYQHFSGVSTTHVYVPGEPIPQTRYATAEFGSWTPKFGIEYQATSKLLLYASYSKGFKAGTFDISNPTAGPIKPEKLTDYEVGIKSTFLDNKVRLNLAGFYYDYTNLQLQTSNGTSFIIINADGAKLYGAEAELSVLPVDRLKIDANAAYLHTRYGDYPSNDLARPGLGLLNFAGHKLVNAPTFSGTFAAEYGVPLTGGEVSLRGEVNYVSKVYLNANNLDLQAQGANAKVNAFLTYRDNHRWTAGLFVRNLTDKITWITSNIANTYGSVQSGTMSAPRTFGVQAGYKF